MQYTVWTLRDSQQHATCIPYRVQYGYMIMLLADAQITYFGVFGSKSCAEHVFTFRNTLLQHVLYGMSAYMLPEPQKVKSLFLGIT